MLRGLRKELTQLLGKRKWDGIAQNETYRLLRYSRSHVSETLAALESEGKIRRSSVGRGTKRIWLTEFYPFEIKGVVRIGLLKSSEYVPFLNSLNSTAVRKGMRIVIRAFDNAPDLISSLHHSVLDIALAPTFTHILFSMTSEAEMILCSLSRGGSSIMENTNSVEDVLATSESSTMNLISRELLREKDVNITFYKSPEQARESFLSGRYRYLAIWEPYLSGMKSAPGIIDLAEGGKDSLLAPCCSAGVNSSYYRNNKEFVDDLRMTYENEVKNATSDHSSYGLKVISEITGFPEEHIRETLRNYEFFCTSDIKVFFNYMCDVGIPVSKESLAKMLI